jgi:hypothetical protein
MDLPCRVVFSAGQRLVEVIVPLLEDEAAPLHIGAWQIDQEDRGAEKNDDSATDP